MAADDSAASARTTAAPAYFDKVGDERVAAMALHCQNGHVSPFNTGLCNYEGQHLASIAPHNLSCGPCVLELSNRGWLTVRHGTLKCQGRPTPSTLQAFVNGPFPANTPLKGETVTLGDGLHAVATGQGRQHQFLQPQATRGFVVTATRTWNG